MKVMLSVAFLLGFQLERPQIISREDWGAKPPVIAQVPHHPKFITIHHTGVKRDESRPFFDKLRGLQAWSQRDDKLAGGREKPMWADIPYHYYISWQGDIAECRQWMYPGDTNTSYDTWGHLLVVVEGNFPEDQFNASQKKALVQLVDHLSRKHRIGVEKIKSHRDYAPDETTCPGQSVYDFMPSLRQAVSER